MTAGRTRKPTQAWAAHASSSSASSSGVPAKLLAVGLEAGAVGLVERLAASHRLVVGVGQHHLQVAEDQQRRAGAATSCSAWRTPCTQRSTSAASFGVTITMSAARAANSNGTREWARAHHERLPLGRAGHDRGALHREEAAFEVDVVQLLAVDEAAGGLVADDGVVLPAVPQAPGHLHRVGRFVEQVAHHGGDLGRGRLAGDRSRGTCAGPRGRPRPHASRSAGANRLCPGSRSRAWRCPSRCGTARCGWAPPWARVRCAG